MPQSERGRDVTHWPILFHEQVELSKTVTLKRWHWRSLQLFEVFLKHVRQKIDVSRIACNINCRNQVKWLSKVAVKHVRRKVVHIQYKRHGYNRQLIGSDVYTVYRVASFCMKLFRTILTFKWSPNVRRTLVLICPVFSSARRTTKFLDRRNRCRPMAFST